MTLRVGIISAGWGTFGHLPAWRSVPGVDVVAVCTSREGTAEAAAANLDIPRAYWNAEDMIREGDIDIIDCGTRPSIRHPMLLSALKAGKHVCTTIPFAADIDCARELHQAWLKSGKIGVIDAYLQWLPAHRLAKEMIKEGFLGRPFGGTCTINLPLFSPPRRHFPYNWVWQSGLGVSALRSFGTHALHLLLFLFGEIEEVVAEDRQLLAEWIFPDGESIRAETNDFAALMLRFKNGMTLQLQISWSATVGAGWSLDVFGSKGRIAATAPSFPTPLDTALRAGTVGSTGLDDIEIPERLMRAPEVTIGPEAEPAGIQGIALAMNHMVEAIRGASSPSPDFGQAWTVERLLEAARRSSNGRCWVRLDEIG